MDIYTVDSCNIFHSTFSTLLTHAMEFCHLGKTWGLYIMYHVQVSQCCKSVMWAISRMWSLRKWPDSWLKFQCSFAWHLQIALYGYSTPPPPTKKCIYENIIKQSASKMLKTSIWIILSQKWQILRGQLVWPVPNAKWESLKCPQGSTTEDSHYCHQFICCMSTASDRETHKTEGSPRVVERIMFGSCP